VCITTNQPDTKSNTNPNPKPKPTNKQHALVSSQLTMVTCPTYPKKFVQDNAIASFLLLSYVTVTQPLSFQQLKLYDDDDDGNVRLMLKRTWSIASILSRVSQQRNP